MQSIVTHITNIAHIIKSIITFTISPTKISSPQPTINTPYTINLLLNQHTKLQSQINSLQDQITQLKFNQQFLEDTPISTYNIIKDQEEIDKLDTQSYPTI